MSSTHLISGTQQPHGTLEEAVFQQPSTYEHKLVGFQMCAWNSLASPSYSVGGSSQWIWESTTKAQAVHVGKPCPHLPLFLQRDREGGHFILVKARGVEEGV